MREQKTNANTLNIAEVQITKIEEKWEGRAKKIRIQIKLSVIEGKSILPRVTKGISILSKVAYVTNEDLKQRQD